MAARRGWTERLITIAIVAAGAFTFWLGVRGLFTAAAAAWTVDATRMLAGLLGVAAAFERRQPSGRPGPIGWAWVVAMGLAAGLGPAMAGGRTLGIVTPGLTAALVPLVLLAIRRPATRPAGFAVPSRPVSTVVAVGLVLAYGMTCTVVSTSAFHELRLGSIRTVENGAPGYLPVLTFAADEPLQAQVRFWSELNETDGNVAFRFLIPDGWESGLEGSAGAGFSVPSDHERSWTIRLERIEPLRQRIELEGWGEDSWYFGRYEATEHGIVPLAASMMGAGLGIAAGMYALTVATLIFAVGFLLGTLARREYATPELPLARDVVA